MSLTRREFHRRTLSGLGAAMLPAGAATAVVQGTVSQRPAAKKRRVLFNCDGHSVFVDAGGDLDGWVENLFAGLENSHVDALLWCDGAGGNTANYASDVLELNGQRAGKVSPALKELIAQGNDPPKVVVREARKRGLDVFYSFRINDIHDAFLPEELPTFKVRHPEWLIGEQKYGYPTALNFAVPEVRQLKFAVIEELFAKYDFDGLEIDFLRGPPFFLPGEEPKHAHVLTALLREIREHLDWRGKQRGRRIELAARVDENLEACRLDGFEVETWAKERLVDMLILGSGVIDIDVEAFCALAEGTGVLVYPCLYGWPSKYNPIPAALARGLAANYWHQGADGIYTFNWFPHQKNLAYQIDLLREIGEPKQLRGKSLMFAAERGRPQKEYPHNWMQAVLPVESPAGKAVDVPLVVGADLAQRGARLLVGLSDPAGGDQLTVALNGMPLAEGQIGDTGITFPVLPARVKRGRNVVSIRREAGGNGSLTIGAVELHVPA